MDKITEQHHKIFLCHAPNYEAGFDDFKKGVRYVSSHGFYLSFYILLFSGATEKFQRISKEIIEIKETLAKDHPDTKLSEMIARVQVRGVGHWTVNIN